MNTFKNAYWSKLLKYYLIFKINISSFIKMTKISKVSIQSPDQSINLIILKHTVI